MKYLALLLLSLCIDRIYTRDCHSLLPTLDAGKDNDSNESNSESKSHDDDDEEDADRKRWLFGVFGSNTSYNMYKLSPEIKRIIPDTDEVTSSCRFDLLNLYGQEGLIKQLYQEGYKLCLGCDYLNDQNQCHSLEVCDKDALCINGSHADPGRLSAHALNTGPWYGCCDKDNSDCNTHEEHISIDVTTGGSVDTTYEFKTCDGYLCNVGTSFAPQITEFKNTIDSPDVAQIIWSWLWGSNSTCQWSAWSSWSVCDCTTMKQTRHRNSSDDTCLGSNKDTRSCEVRSNCPDTSIWAWLWGSQSTSKWSAWSSWSACDCTSMTQTRHRSCPDDTCVGSNADTRSCSGRSICQVSTTKRVTSTTVSTKTATTTIRRQVSTSAATESSSVSANSPNTSEMTSNTASKQFSATPTNPKTSADPTVTIAASNVLQANFTHSPPCNLSKSTVTTIYSSALPVLQNASMSLSTKTAKRISTSPHKDISSTQPVTSKSGAIISLTSKTVPITTNQQVSTSATTENSTTTNQNTNTTVIKTTPSGLPAIFTHSPPFNSAKSTITSQQSSAAPVLQNASVLSTTANHIATFPPKAIMCAQCVGPPEACEVAYYEDLCQPPNHYCINHVTNLASGQRLVERKCGNIQSCYNDWYVGSSDDDKCRQLSSSTHMAYAFHCTYCCVTDGCNVQLRPDHDTLYRNTV